jgi:hypothetical protein
MALYLARYLNVLAARIPGVGGEPLVPLCSTSCRETPLRWPPQSAFHFLS